MRGCLDRLHFVHIPRTGGTSLRQALGIELRRYEHLTAMHYHVEPRYLVSIVRDPYDRAVSLCAFIYRDRLRLERRELTRDDFREWVVGGFMECNRRTSPILYDGEPYAIHVAAPQMQWLTDPVSGRCLVDNVLRFESLENAAMHRLGVSVPHENRSARARQWQRFYDYTTRDIVADRYRDDFIRLGYSA